MFGRVRVCAGATAQAAADARKVRREKVDACIRRQFISRATLGHLQREGQNTSRHTRM